MGLPSIIQAAHEQTACQIISDGLLRVRSVRILGTRREQDYCWSIQRVPVVHHGGVRFCRGP
jgi:hypothetical protein